MKNLVAISIFLCISYTHAESWKHGFSHGSDEYSLKNDKHQILNFSCNEALLADTENGFWLSNEKEKIGIQEDLAILVDNKKFMPSPKETKSDKGSLQGMMFTMFLAEAKSIDVFMPLHAGWIKVASFKVDNIAQFKDCPTVKFKILKQ